MRRCLFAVETGWIEDLHLRRFGGTEQLVTAGFERGARRALSEGNRRRYPEGPVGRSTPTRFRPARVGRNPRTGTPVMKQRERVGRR